MNIQEQIIKSRESLAVTMREIKTGRESTAHPRDAAGKADLINRVNLCSRYEVA